MFVVKTKSELESFITKNFDQIHAYIDKKMEGMPVPLYCSVDIREGKNKFASVDHNLYPAGFNNLCSNDLAASVFQFKKTIQKINPNINTIAIHPESHTKNLNYLENLAYLKETLVMTGMNVLFISFDNQLFADQLKLEMQTASGKKIDFYKAKINSLGNVELPGLVETNIDFIILNHDQSTELEIDWNKLKTPVAPPPFMGWYRREKNKHFLHNKNVVDEFCQHFSIDPDLLQARFNSVEDVDFNSKQGMDRLSQAVNQLLNELPPQSSVFVKASKGTYGMGIMVVQSGEEIENINRKERNKMDIGKNKIKFTSVLVQEGVETILKYDNMPAEITMYLVGGKCVGGFMRANPERSSMSNLNSKGMVFVKFCMSELKQNQDHKGKECAYSVVARLATLASAHEICQEIKIEKNQNQHIGQDYDERCL